MADITLPFGALVFVSWGLFAAGVWVGMVSAERKQDRIAGWFVFYGSVALVGGTLAWRGLVG